jgi:hypothetical protein
MLLAVLFDRRLDHDLDEHLLVEDLRAAVDEHAPVPALPPENDPPLAAFLLHDASQSENDASASDATTKKSELNLGGRCRIRTCDPCRVKAVLYR